MEMDHTHYDLGTITDPSPVIVTALVARASIALSNARTALRRELDKFIPRIVRGEFGPFKILWDPVKDGNLHTIHQVVDNLEGTPWASPLLAEVVKFIVRLYALQGDLDTQGSCATLPLLKLAVSCVRASNLYRHKSHC